MNSDQDNPKGIKEWPIAPTFLSLRQGCTEDNANYNTDGIYYTDYIRGFLADLSHDKHIQNALSLFQFVPKDFLPKDENAENPYEITTDPFKGTVIWNIPLDPKIAEILDDQGKKIIRIDSGTFVNNGRLCDAFRKCNRAHTAFCFRQDSLVGIFADKVLNEEPPSSSKYRQRLEELIGQFNQGRDEESKIRCDAIQLFGETRRLYVHYTCPYSLFEEHVFPIYAQGRVIACLMLGQMARESFVRYKSFENYWAELKKLDSRIPYYLRGINSLDSGEWEEKACVIVNRILTFEKRLVDKIDNKNVRYIRNSFTEIERCFRDDVRGIDIKKQDAVLCFSNALNRAFNNIKEKFDHGQDGFIRMFALPVDTNNEKKLVPIGWCGAKFKENGDFSFSLNQLKGFDKAHTLFQQMDIILGAASHEIKDNFDSGKDIFLPGWLAGSGVAYIVWKRHDNLKLQKKLFDTYRQALKEFYSVAFECYSYIRGAKMELFLETTIQESAHESAHFILPAIDIVENNLEVLPQDVVSLSFSEKYEKYLDSFEKYKAEVLESLNQLREINYGSSLMYSDVKINKNQEEVFDLLYKLKKILSNKAQDSYKNIYYSQSENYVKANIDAKYFNHALYNLLDNAIKYGYEGSYIRINMNVDRRENMLIVEVVSYGIKIETDDKIYQLFVRQEGAVHMASGTGVGLYIVKKICEAHGGKISHTSDPLSDYNIPVLFNYKPRKTLAKKNSLGEIEKFEKELSRLSGSIEQEVVYDTRFVKYANVFASSIYMPTYRNTFRVEIPLN